MVFEMNRLEWTFCLRKLKSEVEYNEGIWDGPVGDRPWNKICNKIKGRKYPAIS